MASDELDREISDIVNRVVTAWVREKREENRMASNGDFKPLVTWPAGTEYLNRVTLPEQEPLATRLVKQVMDVFAKYDLDPDPEEVENLVEVVLTDNS